MRHGWGEISPGSDQTAHPGVSLTDSCFLLSGLRNGLQALNLLYLGISQTTAQSCSGLHQSTEVLNLLGS